jgi:ATP-dependent DNA ligase
LALRTKAGSARACLVAFDLLNLNGEDFRQRPIEERPAALSPLVAGVQCILFSDALVAEGALVFAKPRLARWAWRGSSRSAPAADIRAETADNG